MMELIVSVVWVAVVVAILFAMLLVLLPVDVTDVLDGGSPWSDPW